tara:strand:- start:312 stop:941 length:630 start_codon:yes stop_codon:yes gene_type:complete
MPTTLPQYDEETDYAAVVGHPLTAPLSDLPELYWRMYSSGWMLSWVNSGDTAPELTTDDCGYMTAWEFVIHVNWDSHLDTIIAADAIGIHIDYDDDIGALYSTYAGENVEDASFSGAFFNLDRITFTADVELGSSELDALGEIYNPPGGDLTNMVDSYVAEVAASSLGTMEAAHTFKKIETPEIDDETFDVLEGEEAAQAVTVSTTYTY